MADSIFSQAGFDIPSATAPPAAPVSAPTSEPAVASPSMFEAAGFKVPDKDSHVESLEEKIGADHQKSEAKPGRGIWQAIKDYPGHVLGGMVDTAKLPGTVMTENPYKKGSEEWQFFEDSRRKAIEEGGPALAGIVTTGELPKAGVIKVAEKVAPSTRAVNALVEAVGPENVPSAVNRLQQNPRLTLADVSDPVRTMAQGLIDPTQPKAQNAIVDAVKARAATRLEAANTAFTEAMGPAPDVIKMVEGLKQRARDAGKKEIQPALENAKSVDVSPVIAAIDEKLKPGVNPLLDPGSRLPLSAEQEALARVKQQLTAPSGETLFDAKRLHEVQSDIGDQAYQLSKSPDPKDRRLGSQLRGMNEKLIDQIDEASGAAYRPARAKFKDAKDIHEAFESGFDTLQNRGGLKGALEDSPQAFREWMKDATPEEIVARRLGTRADIEQKINTVKNGALKGETITAIPYNQEKLRALFGDKEANRLIRVMKDSADEAHTNAKLLAGAKTAETLAGRKALEIPEVGKKGNGLLQNLGIPTALAEGASYAAAPLLGGYVPGLGSVAAMVGGGIGWAASRGVQKVAQINALARNAEFAKRALATGSTRQQTVNALLSHPKVVRQLKKSSNALTAP